MTYPLRKRLFAEALGTFFLFATVIGSGVMGEDLAGGNVAIAYNAMQLAGGLLGAWAAHLMFDLPILQVSLTARSGFGQFTGEVVATFGLIVTIIGTVTHRPTWLPASVALYI